MDDQDGSAQEPMSNTTATLPPQLASSSRMRPLAARRIRRLRCPQRRGELLAGADPELAEHLAQVPFHGARAEEELGADLGVCLSAGG
jgi:hypothetical protein